jgi:type I restriction enzyme M protein
MLDATTKAKIDSARDILVGKVPDPKSQVEQITIALIYKFMDDMDRESEELGGKASFFSDGYKKYAWHKLIDPRLSGHERLLLYAEGLEKMNANEHLPQLFRDIFKGAFLPYRDPETLNLFLKEINGFTYDHSERLGDAFEYLLSVLGSQGEAGQFRTPRHIIDFIVSIVDPQKNETVLDPACGTAGFLISAYKHILAANSKDGKGDLLTGDERARLMDNFCGYDISPDMVRLSRANMYLHGFPQPRIHEYDTLTSEERWDERYDVIMANPPFMTPKGGIRPHNRFGIKAKRSEVLFVDYIAEHLNVSGRAGVIVPEGIIFQSQTSYKNLRKMLVENYLWCVVSLPAGIFNPYSGVKTSILLMDKVLVKQIDEVLCVKIANDGFDLGAQRRPIEKNDLPDALKTILAWKNNQYVSSGGTAHTVSRTRILESPDVSLSGDRYRTATARGICQWPMIKIGNILENVKYTAKVQKKDFLTQGRFPIVDQSEKFVAGYWNDEQAVYRVPSPVVLFGDHTRAVKYVDFDFVLGADGIKILKPDNRVVARYLAYCLAHARIPELGYSRHFKELVRIEIPLPPLGEQERIVAELDDYRRIIESAGEILSNYKATIRLAPEWPTLSLGEACERIMDGTHFSPKSRSEGDYLYVTAKNIKEMNLDLTGVTYVSKEDHRAIYARCPVRTGDVLYIKDGATAGVACINSLSEEFSLLSSVAVLRGKPELLDNRFLAYYLNSAEGRANMLAMISGVAITRLTLTKLNSATIPLPPLSTQKEIVADLESERALVDANRELIDRMKKKTQAKLAEIWCEDGTTNGE